MFLSMSAEQQADRTDRQIFSKNNMFSGDHHHLEFPSTKTRRDHYHHRLMSIGENASETDGQDLISHLPDECVQVIFSFLPSSRDRCTCAAVSKKWLLLLAHMRGSHFKTTTTTKDQLGEAGSRCLEATEANDTRVAAMAVGTFGAKLLSKLSLRGGVQVTDFGLHIISQSFPKLKSLALWDCFRVTGAGLACIAQSCPDLEILDISNSPWIDDDGLVPIGKNCSNLSSLTIESCPFIGNSALDSFATWSSRLESISISKCPLVSDVGIIALVTRLPKLSKVRLASLNVADGVLEAIGNNSSNGGSIRALCLENIVGFTMAGFLWIESAQNLEFLSLKSCTGLTVDSSFGALIGGGEIITQQQIAVKPTTMKGCFRDLKHVDIKNCDYLSDSVLIRLTKSTQFLEILRLESCNGISTYGLMGALRSCSKTLRVLSFTKCTSNGNHRRQQQQHGHRLPLLDSLTLKKCKRIEDKFLSKIAPACTQTRHIGLVGLTSITDRGICSFLQQIPSSSSPRTVRVSLSGCTRITDWSVMAMARAFGSRLRSLSLGGCRGLTDRSLEVIGEFFQELVELDVSGCGITDHGVARLAAAEHQKLEVLSLAGCSGITDRSLGVLEVMCGGLVGLNLKCCSGVTREAMESVRTTLWWCDLLY